MLLEVRTEGKKKLFNTKGDEIKHAQINSAKKNSNK